VIRPELLRSITRRFGTHRPSDAENPSVHRRYRQFVTTSQMTSAPSGVLTLTIQFCNSRKCPLTCLQLLVPTGQGEMSKATCSLPVRVVPGLHHHPSQQVGPWRQGVEVCVVLIGVGVSAFHGKTVEPRCAVLHRNADTRRRPNLASSGSGPTPHTAVAPSPRLHPAQHSAPGRKQLDEVARDRHSLDSRVRCQLCRCALTLD